MNKKSGKSTQFWKVKPTCIKKSGTDHVHVVGNMTKFYSVFNHVSLQWCHNEHDGVSNHRHFDCFHNHLFRRRSKKISKLRITGLCEGNSQVTGEFQAQGASYVENVSIWWHHHDKLLPMNFKHKGPVTWKMFLFDDIIMINCFRWISSTRGQ